MKDLFVPSGQALALKELEFDELVIAKYQKLSESANYQLQLLQKERNCNRLDTAISAPLFQQAFSFFREKGYDNSISRFWNVVFKRGYVYEINGKKSCEFITHKKAELACLIKLIEICKK